MITQIDRRRIAKVVGDIISLRSELLHIVTPYRDIAADKPQVDVITESRQCLYEAATKLQSLVDSLKS